MDIVLTEQQKYRVISDIIEETYKIRTRIDMKGRTNGEVVAVPERQPYIRMTLPGDIVMLSDSIWAFAASILLHEYMHLKHNTWSERKAWSYAMRWVACHHYLRPANMVETMTQCLGEYKQAKAGARMLGRPELITWEH